MIGRPLIEVLFEGDVESPPPASPARKRAALRWYGGKASIAPWIVSLFPPHRAYCEPFGGGASVLLAKPRSHIETYNDLDGAAWAFFACLRDRPEDLIRAIALTPFSREEVKRADLGELGISDLERARRLYVRSGQTIHGAPTPTNDTGWRCEKTGTGGNARAWTDTSHLWAIADRLRGVQIDREDAFACIRRFTTPDCLLYADPPYQNGTRGRRWAGASYVHEFSDHDHARLATLLRDADAGGASVAVSGYASPLYDDLYRGWERHTRETVKTSHAAATEVVWLSPNATRRRAMARGA